MKLFKKSTCSQKLNSNLDWINFLIVLSFLLTTVAIGLRSALRAIADVDTDINTTVLFQPPPEEEQPENTEGAASRHNKVCSQDFPRSQQQESLGDRDENQVLHDRLDHLNLIAVVPARNYGLTVADRPNFWFYLPKTSAQQAILSIKEKDSNPHWQQSINLTGESGIIGVKLSDDAPALEIGKNYQWAIILVCGSKPHPNDPFVTSWIKRVDESIINNGKGEQSFIPTRLEKASMYARKGIWYDALDILIAEKKFSLDNWSKLWFEYLQSGGLDEIADEPIVEEGVYKLLKKTLKKH